MTLLATYIDAVGAAEAARLGQPPVPETVPGTPLTEILPRRICNRLREGHTATLRELVGTTVSELLHRPLIGPRALYEIRDALARLGLHLRGDCGDLLVPEATYNYPGDVVVQTRRCPHCGWRTASFVSCGPHPAGALLTVRVTQAGPPEVLIVWAHSLVR